MPNMPCRECDRIRAKPHANDARKAVAEKREVREKIDDANSGRDKPVSSPALATQPGGVEKGSKADRLAVAREALTRAEISRRYREKLGDEYRKRNSARMRARRKK